jgi:hypothetical protein
MSEIRMTPYDEVAEIPDGYGSTSRSLAGPGQNRGKNKQKIKPVCQYNNKSTKTNNYTKKTQKGNGPSGARSGSVVAAAAGLFTLSFVGRLFLSFIFLSGVSNRASLTAFAGPLARRPWIV